MFPEQIRLLKEMEEEDKKVPKPTLSEDEKLEINDLLVQSWQDQTPLILKLWNKGFIEETGPIIIAKIDPYQRMLYGELQGETKLISFNSLIGARTE